MNVGIVAPQRATTTLSRTGSKNWRVFTPTGHEPFPHVTVPGPQSHGQTVVTSNCVQEVVHRFAPHAPTSRFRHLYLERQLPSLLISRFSPMPGLSSARHPLQCRVGSTSGRDRARR